MKNNTTKSLVLSLITVLAIGIITAGGTYAYISASGTATNVTIKSGNLTMSVIGTSGANSVTFMPTTCTNTAYAIKKTITASAVNTGGGNPSFTLTLTPTKLDSGLKIANMKWALTTSSSSCSDGLVGSGNFSSAAVNTAITMVANDSTLTTDSTDKTKVSKTYYLYIWLDKGQTSAVSGSLAVSVSGKVTNDPSAVYSTGK